LPTGLYILLVLISFIFFFFYIFLMISRRTRWANFRNLFTESKHLGCRWSIWASFYDISRDVAMATNFVKKRQLISPFSSLWHYETEWDIGTSMCARK